MVYYVYEDIRYKLFKIPFFSFNIEVITVEFHKIKQKWLFIGTYKPLVVNDMECINELIKTVDHFSSKYENFLVICDLYTIINHIHLNTLFQLYNLDTLINTPSSYQSHNPICTDHTLINHCLNFLKHLTLRVNLGRTRNNAYNIFEKSF